MDCTGGGFGTMVKSFTFHEDVPHSHRSRWIYANIWSAFTGSYLWLGHGNNCPHPSNPEVIGT
jgi:hypothetical protein